MKSVFGLRSTFLCADPVCKKEAVTVAIARSEEPDAVKVDLQLPHGWTLTDYRTYCPEHAPHSQEMQLAKLLSALQTYRNEVPALFAAR